MEKKEHTTAARGDDNTADHGKRATRGGAYTFLVISVLAVALAAMLLAAASGLFGDIVRDPMAEKLPGGIEGANQAPAGQRTR